MSDDTGGNIGYYEAQAIRTIVREEIEKAVKKIIAAQQSAHADWAYWCCPKCNSFVSVKFDICGLCKSPRR